ncbi:polysaccharide pyruvyl transferase family protein [Streptomyces sp. NPDC005574]|uniref:polysaccharide pyruvyl transferase family protein n=1 Tax=Streptomyces sp. NPDC005574 TaxID=3156891 RepID=UPI0033B65F14
MHELLLRALPGTRGKVLLTGWFSFPHGEATAGDVLALERVSDVLGQAGITHDVAWSAEFRPEALHLDDVRPEDYSHLVFVCGPLHGEQIEHLHRRFAHCVRIAVGTSVIAPGGPAVTGFHRVLAHDASDIEPGRDLATRAPAAPPLPVVGVVLTHDRHEPGQRRRPDRVAGEVTAWLAGKDCARLELDTRLDSRDWRRCATPAQFESVLTRLDLVVTDRLDGLVLALRAGVPVLAVDPVPSGAKLAAQARACDWPALVPAERLDVRELDRWWHWCLTTGPVIARQMAAEFREGVVRDGADRLVETLWTRLEDRAG